MARKQMLKGEFFLADAFNRMLEKGARFLTEPMTVWQDCGVPSYHLATNRWLLEHGNDNSRITFARRVNSTMCRPSISPTTVSSKTRPSAHTPSSSRLSGDRQPDQGHHRDGR